MGARPFACRNLAFPNLDGISESRGLKTLGAVAGRLFRTRTAKFEFFVRSGPSERRRSPSRNYAAQECIFDDEPLSLYGRTSNGRSVPKDGRSIVAGRKRGDRALEFSDPWPGAAPCNNEGARFQCWAELGRIRGRGRG